MVSCVCRDKALFFAESYVLVPLLVQVCNKNGLSNELDLTAEIACLAKTWGQLMVSMADDGPG